MKKIYIVLTHTRAVLSRIIKIFTKDEFSHVSIALDAELQEMYSFGRLYPNNPFVGGFVHEYINKGTFKRFYKTKTKIYALDVTLEQYENVKQNIQRIQKQKDKYKFNILGLFAVSVNKKINKEYSFYCAEFVKYVIEQAGIETNLPEIVKPENFKNIPNLQEVYKGYLRKYPTSKIKLVKLLRKNLLITTSNNL